MQLLTNTELWNSLRLGNTNFKAMTSAATDEYFSESTFERLLNYDRNTLSEFYNLSMRSVFAGFHVYEIAQDPLGFFSKLTVEYGRYLRKIAIKEISSVDAPWHIDNMNGKSVDPYIVRKPSNVEEQWWDLKKVDIANIITLADDYVLRESFTSQYGVSELMTQLVSQLKKNYEVNMYLNKLETLNGIINSEKWPLQEDTQKVHVDVEVGDDGEWTDDSLRAFILRVNNTLTAMKINMTGTNKFNAAHFKSAIDPSHLVLLVRAGFKNSLRIKTLAGAFNKGEIAFDLDRQIEVDSFGGLIPYKQYNSETGEYTTRLYAVRDENFGNVIGYSTQEGKKGVDNVEVELDDSENLFYKDPNKDIMALLVDDRLITECFTFNNGTPKITSIYNPRGLYTNTFLSMMYSLVSDPSYTCVAFTQGN